MFKMIITLELRKVWSTRSIEIQDHPGTGYNWQRYISGWAERRKPFPPMRKRKKRAGEDMPQWQIDYTMAQWYFEEGDLENAETFGVTALELAPPDAAPIIQQFLSLLGSGGTETEG